MRAAASEGTHARRRRFPARRIRADVRALRGRARLGAAGDDLVLELSDDPAAGPRADRRVAVARRGELFGLKGPDSLAFVPRPSNTRGTLMNFRKAAATV